MFNLRKYLFTGIATGALFALMPMMNTSANTRKATHAYRPRTKRLAKPVFGELKHDYTSWTLNGRSTMWNRPTNDGYRHPVISRNQLNYIGKHANKREPFKYTFFLDYTATYYNHKLPDYFYVTSGKTNGWVYRKGLREIGDDDPTNINVITNRADVYTPHANYITKGERRSANDLSYELASSRLAKNKSSYRLVLNDAYWRANNLGTLNKRTRKSLRKLIRASVNKSNRIYRHALKSKKFRDLLESNY